jgi:hypothetical protein
MNPQTQIRFLLALKVVAGILAVAPAALLVLVLRYGAGFLGGSAPWAAALAVGVAFLVLTLPSVIFLIGFRGVWFLEIVALLAAGVIQHFSEKFLAARLPWHDATPSFLAIVPTMLAYLLFRSMLRRAFLLQHDTKSA